MFNYADYMRFLLILILMLPFLLSAETVYKSVDDEGNIIFTDKPIEGSEEIKIKKAQSVETPTTKILEYAPANKIENKDEYTKLIITIPVNNATIHSNEGNLTVNVSLEPVLKETDQFVLYMDGQQVATGNNSKFSLNNINRGTHKLSVAVTSEDDKILRRSDTIEFHLRKFSILSATNKPKSEQPSVSSADPLKVSPPL